MHATLVPVDGSKHARNALKYTITAAKEGHITDIHIIHVMSEILPLGDLPLPDADLVQKSRQKQAMQVIKSACNMLDKAGLTYTKHIEIGPIASSIVKHAKKHHCDSIIMGTRGMGALGNLVLGSTANQVIQLAKMPVTLVK